MRFSTFAVSGVALCAVFLQGCIGLVGAAAMSAAAPKAQPGGAQAASAEPAGAKSGNGGAQAAAMKVVKAGAMGAVGGPVGYGILSQSPKLARAMLGRKAAKSPKPAAVAAKPAPDATDDLAVAK